MKLFVDIGFESINKHGEELCGDKIEIIRNENSMVAVLADGLGSGVKANILSTLTSKIIGTILANGLEIEEAVETIAHTLPVCSTRGMAYSTFSILQIFNNGQGYLVEFDNPAVFRFKKGKSVKLQPESREIGGKTIMESRFPVDYEDMFVMASDGVIHAGIGRTMNLGWQWENVNEYIQRTCRNEMSCKKVAKLLISAVDSLYGGEPGDDATVVAVKIRKPINLSVMVGPPVDSSEDSLVVGKLMSMEGKKAVCGGTTSQIVAKTLGRELKVDFDYVNPGIPPVAELEGIDLVTEGVLTLKKTLELLNSCISSESTMRDFLNLNRKDGASRLAKLLLENSTNIYFIVGRSINPAHQNPEFPLNFGLKLKLVDEIAACLRGIGKHVEIEYH
ncbi:MAG: SpoIIE family protein phosphatase [Clostridiales bacterium]|nr:SpoIIE family protein phosphatase [Clostridiales bacterium]